MKYQEMDKKNDIHNKNVVMPWFLNEECGRWYSQPTLGAHT
jgi:hypothetical protein